MNQDNDVERLFSWLQTPDIRYREFAGAREITDAVVTVRAEVSTPATGPRPSHNTQLSEEYPEDQYPDQSQTTIKVEPAPRESTASAPVTAPHPESLRQEPTIVAPDPLPPTPAPEPAPAAEGHDEHPGRSLDSVFNRLSGGRSGESDPHDRSRTDPGSGPPGGKPR